MRWRLPKGVPGIFVVRPGCIPKHCCCENFQSLCTCTVFKFQITGLEVPLRRTKMVASLVISISVLLLYSTWKIADVQHVCKKTFSPLSYCLRAKVSIGESPYLRRMILAAKELVMRYRQNGTTKCLERPKKRLHCINV